MIFKFIGLMAAFLTSTGFVPQIFKALKSRHVKDVSIFTLLLTAAGTLMWTIYGIYLGDTIIIWANIFTCSTVVFLIIMKIVLKQP